MTQEKIAIASILKPVDETRMYRKIGHSLAKAGHSVYIAGFKGHSESKEIKLFPLFFFRRLSFQRILASIKIYFWLLKIRPSILIITTHELLWISVLYKLLKDVKLIYDVQENYYLNIKRTNAFPPVLRDLIAVYVRWKEKLTAPFVDHFFLAEKGYKDELNFLGDKFTVVENKALSGLSGNGSQSGNMRSAGEQTTGEDRELERSVRKQTIGGDSENINKINRDYKLLFTGTLAESTGIFDCIDMAIKLHKENPQIQFTIAGMCHISEDYKKIKKRISGHEWIKIIGGNHPVAHQVILKLISESDAGFVYYTDLELVYNTMPTKLYEYLAFNLPILLQNHPQWLSLANSYNAAVAIDHQDFNAKSILDKLHDQYFYSTKPGQEVLWAGEEEKVLRVVKKELF